MIETMSATTTKTTTEAPSASVEFLLEDYGAVANRGGGLFRSLKKSPSPKCVSEPTPELELEPLDSDAPSSRVVNQEGQEDEKEEEAGMMDYSVHSPSAHADPSPPRDETGLIEASVHRQEGKGAEEQSKENHESGASLDLDDLASGGGLLSGIREGGGSSSRDGSTSTSRPGSEVNNVMDASRMCLDRSVHSTNTKKEAADSLTEGAKSRGSTKDDNGAPLIRTPPRLRPKPIMKKKPSVGEVAARYCRSEITELLRTSRVINDHLDADEKDCIAPFSLEEIEVGKYLGRGEFSTVHEITGFLPYYVDDSNSSGNVGVGREWDEDEEAARKFLAVNAIRNKNKKSKTTDDDDVEARYALKFLRPDLLKDEDKFLTAARDLAVEAQFLSAVEHPHIIKLRGWTSGGTDGYIKGGNEGYFIILDRLSETLEDRIQRWAREKKAFRESRAMAHRSMRSMRTRMSFRRSSTFSRESIGEDEQQHYGSSSAPPRGGYRRRGSNSAHARIGVSDSSAEGSASSTTKSSSSSTSGSLVDRVKIAYDIAGAMEYLHSKSIIFRDLKPANLGFDVRGDVKLFDFGLAKELPHDRDMNEERMRMSMAGSMRYMSPEMMTCRPYNLKADVYTYSIVLHEILSSKKAYTQYKSKDAFLRGVAYGTDRPRVSSNPRKVPEPVAELLGMCWEVDPDDRPTMELVRNVLRFQVMNLHDGCDGIDAELDHKRRRSLGSIGTTPTSSRSNSMVVKRDSDDWNSHGNHNHMNERGHCSDWHINGMVGPGGVGVGIGGGAAYVKEQRGLVQ